MKIFVDTEFTDLTKDNKLISIALVCENGKSFYAELTDTYSIRDCSDFVKAEVLPKLIGGDYRCTFAQCSRDLVHWIHSLEGYDDILAMDAIRWDMPHVESLIGHDWPETLRRREAYKFMIPYKTEELLQQEFNFKPHNALHDAMLMKLAYKLGFTCEI